MEISDIIHRKGSDVVTIAPTAGINELVALLAEKHIGAVVVSEDGEQIAGIVSERDVVSALAAKGADVLSLHVGDIMTGEVQTCTHGDPVAGLAHTMTERRVRHIPVVEDGKLVGIVSIGDVVKIRMDQLTEERNHLLSYLHG